MKEELEPYQQRFPVGSVVRVAGRETLERFAREWHFHDPLESERVRFAGMVAEVAEVGFDHGGDVLYGLKGISGQWHEACLEHGETK